MMRSHKASLATLLAVALLGCQQSDVPGPTAAEGASTAAPARPAPPPMAAVPTATIAPPATAALPPATVASPATVPAPLRPQVVGANPPARYAVDDEEMLWNVMTALGALPGTPSEAIAVTVSKGVVTVDGQVHDSERRELIVQIVSRVKGVQSVVDKLHVGES